MAQLDMFSRERPPKAAARTAKRVAVLLRKPTIEERFETFHKENPHVFVEMLRLARCRMDRGERRIGAKALWEELRVSLRVNKLGNWKLNNTLVSLYSRALINEDPRLASVIEIRRRGRG